MYEPREDSYLLLKSVRKLAKGNVLEIGTGSGILAFEASRSDKVDFVIGVDIDKESIDYCNNKYDSNNLIFLQSDLFEIFKSKSDISGAKSTLRAVQAPINSVSESNIFKNLIKNKFKFDTIIFNPPYLPKEFMYPREFDDKAIFGGKKGYELIEKFLNKVKNYLDEKGIILLLFSSLTHKDKIDDIIKKNKLKYKEIDKLKLDFEELYVYKIFC